MARHKILTFAVMYFFQAWTLGVDSKMVHLLQPGLSSSGNLDMVPKSVDDMYEGCIKKMGKKVKEYLQIETNTGGIFKQAWTKAETCASNKTNSVNNELPKLSYNHIRAICAYTGGQPKIYQVFNKAVQTSRYEYTTSFQFHSLHFLLTDAIRILKLKQNTCHTTYRRTKMEFSGKVGIKIRFGFFASSSLDKGINTLFGDKTCFEIKTCFGADLKSFPKLGNHEKEVLIPPYEVFIVTAVLKKENDKNLWCDVVYTLKSITKPQSNLNCKLFR
ncbi:erythroblast NAD(P)(+)--arginine ADP-ribosyltransferase-like [Oncorhynchus masou masou]|uniref:erythroblast NAD(P)(+)--arginine ADP-ribosyltransferase-like n=1 Tax=Oncorhynchus masou masou TaxID=90313 RepID=UPI003182DCCC